MKIYRLQITANSSEVFNSISKILHLNPLSYAFKEWIYEYIEFDDSPYYNFIHNFLDILDPKLVELKNIGIKSSDIIFWMLYEYEKTCGMEFQPQEMKRLGESNITLCIDCWEKQV